MDTAETTCGTKVQTTQPQEGTDIYCSNVKRSRVMSVNMQTYGYVETSPGTDALELTDAIKPQPTRGGAHNKSNSHHSWPHAP